MCSRMRISRQLVAAFSWRKPEFNPSAFRMRFVMDEMVIIPAILSTRLSMTREMDKSPVGDLAVKQRSLTYMVKLVRNNQQIHFRTSLHNFHQYWVWIPNPSEYQTFLPSTYFYDLLCGTYFKGTEFVEEFTIYLHSNFHLDVALFTFFFRRGCGFLAPVAYYLHHKIKEKYLVHSDVKFLYIEKAVTSIKSAYFSKTWYKTKFRNLGRVVRKWL